MPSIIELTAEQRRETVNTRQLWDAFQTAAKRRDGYVGSAQASLVAAIVKNYLPMLPMDVHELRNLPLELVEDSASKLDPFFS